MGIPSFSKLLTLLDSKQLARVMRETSLSDYRGKTIAIDMHQVLHRVMKKIVRENRKHIESPLNGKVTTHLHATLYRVRSWVREQITPVIIFDRRAPKLKEPILEKRRERSRNSKEQYLKCLEEGITGDELGKYLARLVGVSRSQVSDCLTLLDRLGIPALWPPGEADPQCAAMTQRAEVYAAMSEDTDLLAFGAEKLIRPIRGQRDRYQEIDRTALEQALGLEVRETDLTSVEKKTLAKLIAKQRHRRRTVTRKYLEAKMHERFVDLVILLGIGNFETPEKLDYRKAVQLMSTHRTLEQALKGRKLPENYFAGVKEWRGHLLHHDLELIDPKEVEVNRKVPKLPEAIRYMCLEHGFGEDIEEVICDIGVRYHDLDMKTECYGCWNRYRNSKQKYRNRLSEKWAHRAFSSYHRRSERIENNRFSDRVMVES